MDSQETRDNAKVALEHLDWVRGLARSLVRDASLADDIAQETWLAALRRTSAAGMVSRGWLARVVRNFVRQEHRRAAIRNEHEGLARSAEETGPTDELVDRVQTQRVVVDAVLALDGPYRRVILLRYFDGLAPREIARRQGIPVATVKTRLRRGLAQLRDALDARHGGDGTTWMSAVTVLATPVKSGFVTGKILFGGLAMGTMMKVSGAAVVAAVCLYFVTRTPPVETRPVERVEFQASDAEIGVQGELSLAGAAESERRSPVAKGPALNTRAQSGTHVLRVILEGASDEDARLTRVTLQGVDDRREWPSEIRESWACRGVTSEFDLDPFLASVATRRDDLRLDGFEVSTDHPLHVSETTRVPRSRGTQMADGRTVYEIRVRRVPAAVLHGRLVREGGESAAEGFVGAMLLEDSTWERPTTEGSVFTDVPIEGEGRAVECDVDGGFELRVPASGRYALVSYEEGRRPTTVWAEARVGTRVDVGTLVLEPGHAIAGHTVRRGNPLTGATVTLTQPRVLWAADPADVERGMNRWILSWRTFRTASRSVTLTWLADRFELLVQEARVGEDGAFAFSGLAPRDYQLRVVELPDSRFLPNGWDNPGLDDEGPDERTVRAPAHGLVLEFNWTSVRFEIEGVLEGEDHGRLILRTRSLYPGNERTFVPEFWSTQLDLSADELTFVLQAPPEKQLLGEIMFPGRQPALLDFRTPEAGGEVVIPVKLTGAEQPAALVVELENRVTEIPETFSVLLKRVGQADTPEFRTVVVQGGQLHMDDIVPGQYRVIVCASEDPNHAGLFYRNGFDLELHPGESVARSIRMRSGAGLRLTLRNGAGELLSGQYELYDSSGTAVRLVMVDIDRWKPGSDQWATTGRFGPGTQRSSDPIQAGRYRLVVISPGYENRSVPIELREGEYEDVEVTLSE